MSEKDVLKKADKLIQEAKPQQNIPKSPKENPHKNQTIPNNVTKKNIYRFKKMGYRRYPRYKKPAWWQFILALLIIMVLGYIIAIQLPYIPM